MTHHRTATLSQRENPRVLLPFQALDNRDEQGFERLPRLRRTQFADPESRRAYTLMRLVNARRYLLQKATRQLQAMIEGSHG